MDLTDARALARSVLGEARLRWRHVISVGRRAEDLAGHHPEVDETLVIAAWLHDVGYGQRVSRLGQHAIDGANFLALHDCPAEVIQLVAYHTGAAFEATERGLTGDLAIFNPPNRQALDILTMIDLSVGPDGSSVVDKNRILEILKRYSNGDPVHRAVTRSQNELLTSSTRAKRLLGLPDNWPIVAC